MLTLRAAGRSDVGRVRESNEDDLLVTGTIVAVADGLGGHASGEVASRIAVDRLAELDAGPELVHPDDVAAAITDANQRIVDAMRAHPEHEGMGTTLTGLGLVEYDGVVQCVVFNVGDSRVYRLRDGGVEQVTVDHSEVEELRAAGVISADEVARHPRRNVVTRCLGSMPGPAADLWVHSPASAERYVVCSDGLTNELPDETIGAVLRDYPDPAAAADVLVAQALDAGGRDNVTVIVADLT